MTYEVKTEIEIPINHIGHWFRISGRNNINGTMHLTNDRGDHYHLSLYKNEAVEIDISEMIENNKIDFTPLYIEFHSDNPDIAEITIEVPTANLDHRLIPQINDNT